MNKISYSQFKQDIWVLDKFPQKKGYFVDLGFQNGIEGSNTYLLEQFGWIGIGIDPFLDKANREFRPNTILDDSCVYDKETIVDFISAGGLGGIKEHIDTYKDNHWVKTGTLVQKETTTLDSVLDKYNSPKTIDYLSIDTEGSEYKILSTLKNSKYRFTLITVEHNYELNKRHMIQNLLINMNYMIDCSYGMDDFYIDIDYFKTTNI